jgi:hypothetical protein
MFLVVDDDDDDDEEEEEEEEKIGTRLFVFMRNISKAIPS